jgi:hypothetical protein
MSGVNTDQTSVGGESQLVHLVYTEYYEADRVHRLFIHYSGQNTTPHRCYAFTCSNTSNQVIKSTLPQRSADYVVNEHGWFDDVSLFRQMCIGHPVPQGQDSESVFISWRDNVLAFLDANYRQSLWLRIN